MLRLALESEQAAVAQFNAGAQECHDLGDHGTAAVFEEMVRDEESHADWFESQLDAIERVGAPAVPRPAGRHRDAVARPPRRPRSPPPPVPAHDRSGRGNPRVIMARPRPMTCFRDGLADHGRSVRRSRRRRDRAPAAAAAAPQRSRRGTEEENQ